MTEHTPPPWLAPARAQLALLWRSGRVWLLLAALLAPLLYAQLERVREGGSAIAEPLRGRSPVLLEMADPLVLILPAWALLVWLGEAWGEREYHWSMPVDRGAHDAWRLAAGGVWLLAAMALLVAVGTLFALREGSFPALVQHGPAAWITFVSTPLLLYLLVSIVPLASGRPLVTIVALVAGWLILVGVSDDLGFEWPMWMHETVLEGDRSLVTALYHGLAVARIEYLQTLDLGRPISMEGRTIGKWIAANAIWYGVALGGVTLALRRRP